MEFNPLELFLLQDQLFLFLIQTVFVLSFFSRKEQMLALQIVLNQSLKGRVWKIGLRFRNEKKKLQLVSVCGAEIASGPNI